MQAGYKESQSIVQYFRSVTTQHPKGNKGRKKRDLQRVLLCLVTQSTWVTAEKESGNEDLDFTFLSHSGAPYWHNPISSQRQESLLMQSIQVSLPRQRARQRKVESKFHRDKRKKSETMDVHHRMKNEKCERQC